jgi:hypothetical protein
MWVAMAAIVSTSPVSPDTPAEGRLGIITGMFFSFTLLATFPFLIRLKGKQEKAKAAKAAEKEKLLPETYAEAQELAEAGAADMPWVLKFVRFRYRVYTALIPADETSRRFKVRTWGSRNAHRRFVGPIARAYDWVMAWALLGIGWLVFGSLAWGISQGWSKLQGFAKGHLWQWFTSFL